MSVRRWIALAALAALPARAHAQDFASPWAFWPPGGPLALLEHGLPAPAPRVTAEAAITRWYGLPELETRALAAGVRVGRVSVAAGASQTGAPELGWTTLGVGVGHANGLGGVAVRAVARRDRLTPFAFDGDARTAGGEVGIGAWAAAGGAFRLWATAPQLWREGAAPPFRRPLALGIAWTAPGMGAWLARESVLEVSGARHGVHEAGITLGAGGGTLWCAVRDRPLRAALGVSASRGPFAAAGSVASHPVLAETSRLGVRLSGGAR